MDFTSGDILKVTSRGFAMFGHYGIIIEDSGMYYVWHNTPDSVNGSGGGIVKEPLNEFLAGRQLIGHASTGLDSQTVESRSTALFGRPFNFSSFNCEHFVNQVAFGKVFSPFVSDWLLTFFISVIIMRK